MTLSGTADGRKNPNSTPGTNLSLCRRIPTHARHTLQQCTYDGCTRACDDLGPNSCAPALARVLSNSIRLLPRGRKGSPLLHRRRCQPHVEVSTNFLCKYRTRDTLPPHRGHTTMNASSRQRARAARLTLSGFKRSRIYYADYIRKVI